jgi:hypothetical protein
MASGSTVVSLTIELKRKKLKDLSVKRDGWVADIYQVMAHEVTRQFLAERGDLETGQNVDVISDAFVLVLEPAFVQMECARHDKLQIRGSIEEQS